VKRRRSPPILKYRRPRTHVEAAAKVAERCKVMFGPRPPEGYTFDQFKAAFAQLQQERVFPAPPWWPWRPDKAASTATRRQTDRRKTPVSRHFQSACGPDPGEPVPRQLDRIDT
jgi:hypothetical protein